MNKKEKALVQGVETPARGDVFEAAVSRIVYLTNAVSWHSRRGIYSKFLFVGDISSLYVQNNYELPMSDRSRAGYDRKEWQQTTCADR